MVQFLNNNKVFCTSGFNDINLVIDIDDATLQQYSKCNDQPLILDYTTNNTKVTYTLRQQQILYGKPIFFVENVLTEPVKYESKKINLNECVVTC